MARQPLTRPTPMFNPSQFTPGTKSTPQPVPPQPSPPNPAQPAPERPTPAPTGQTAPASSEKTPAKAKATLTVATPSGTDAKPKRNVRRQNREAAPALQLSELLGSMNRVHDGDASHDVQWGTTKLPIPVDHALHAPHKQLRLYLPQRLILLTDEIRGHWVSVNPDWGQEHGVPGKAAFKEGLMRHALHHIDDPDLFTLIPIDSRRNLSTIELPTLPPPHKPVRGAFPVLPFDVDFTEPRFADDGRYSSEFLSALNKVARSWAFAHPEWLTTYGGIPGAAAFREGLIRLGLKHINDIRLAALIPV